MAQCESKVFFPDDPAQQPQFSDCPRQAVTRRKITGLSKVVRLCAKCAKMWEEQVKPKAAGAS